MPPMRRANRSEPPAVAGGPLRNGSFGCQRPTRYRGWYRPGGRRAHLRSESYSSLLPEAHQADGRALGGAEFEFARGAVRAHGHVVGFERVAGGALELGDGLVEVGLGL